MRTFARIRLLSAALVFSLMSGAVAVLPPLPASAAEPELSPVAPIPSSPVAAQKPSMPTWTAPSVVWPTGGGGETTVGGSLARLGGPTPVGGFQVSVTADPGTSDSVAAQEASAAGQVVQLNVLTQPAVAATGAKGVVFTAGAAGPLGGPVKLAVSYAGFGGAFGAGWGSRLRLVAMPGCAISTPSLPECQVQTEVPGWVNDPVASTVSAPVTLPVLGSPSALSGAPVQSAAVSSEPQVFALTAGASSESGDFKASTLTQAAAWSHGGSSGDFSTTVALKTPPVPGLSPSVSLNYSSGAVDGLTSAMNTQASIVGEGWSLGGVSFVERSYRPCKDDGGPANSGDLCWVSQAPVSVVLNGRSSQLLVDGSGNWFAEDGALGWRVQHLTGTGNPDNGLYDRESFKVTTMDGTQYFFGYRARTDKGGAQRMPVYFHDEPWSACYSAAGFFASYCPEVGYRWNLDYAVDRFGNTMTYNWAPYGSQYGANNGERVLDYDITSHLDTIDFGSNSTSGVGAAGQVAFTYAYRCHHSVSDCDSNHDANYWPDTPWDQFCWPALPSCPGVTAPTFWTPYRLIRIESRAWDYVTGTWAVTDQLNLQQIFPATGDFVSPAGDDTPPSLWLDTLLRQNNERVLWAAGVRLANRVFWGNDLGRSPMMHYRVSQLIYGSGGNTQVVYSAEECTRSNVYDGRADHNVLKCFPQWEDDQFRWYHKYVVTQVSDQDMAASNHPAVVTRYTYQGGATSPQGQEYADAMWRFDDNWLTPMSRRTYSKWRGYSLVYTYTGAADGTGMQKQAQDIYFRGMNGDRSGDTIGGIGGTWGARQVNISDGTTTFADHEGMPGKLLRHAEYDNTTGVWRDMHITTYQILAAGTMATNGGNPPAYSAWRVLPTQTRALLYGTGGTLLRTSTVNTTYDSTYPLVTYVADLGETQSNLNPVGNADDRCTSTSYVPADTTRWLIGFPKETMAINCTVSPPTAASYLAGQRFYYDGQALGVLGAGAGMGKTTKTEALKNVTGNITSGFVYTWQVTGQNTVFDSYGRATTALDAAGRTTVTAYLPAASVRGAVKAVTTTTTGTGGLSLGGAATNFDIRFGSPTVVTDVNLKVTRAEYDWHGYLAKVWRNHRAPTGTAGITPDAEYTYAIRSDLPSYVGTKVLAPDGISQLPESFSYVDGLMRPRRTETPSADGSGRVVTDIWMGAAGQTVRTLTVSMTGLPDTGFDGWPVNSAYQDVQYGYNGLGEQTSVTPYSQGVALGSTWNTTTDTDGRTTTVTPPAGGTVTTTVTNAQGKTAELRQAKPGGGTLNTVYTYNRLGQLATVTDPASNTWTYTYDRLGRKTSTTDPDAGTSSTTYTVDGLTESTTDGRGQQLWTTYDGLGRKTELRAGTATGTVLSQWSYDTAVFTGATNSVKGQLASTTRKDATGDYKTEALNYNNAYQVEQTKFTAPMFGAGGTSDLIYTTSTTHNPNGSPAATTVPAAGGLSAETLTTGYNTAGLPSTVTSLYGSTSSPIIASTAYTYDGKVGTQILGAVGKQVKNTSTYELATRRLLNSTMSTETTTQGTFGSKLIKGYTYDPAGNITATSNNYPGTSTDNKECFTYDTLRRLTQAWTLALASTCGTPQKAGPDPYWRTWGIDDLGNRTSEIDKNADGTSANTWTYTNGAAGSVKPHQVKTITPTTGPTRTFAYDNAGNMTTRTTDTGTAQTLTWDKENHLATLSQTGTTASYLYNTDGSRLLATNDVGGTIKTTLYLPDGTELEKTSTGAITGQRYLGGVAVRDITGLKWTITNHQSTPLAQVTASDLTVAARQMMPYGQPRGTQPTWLGSKGYVGGTTDTPTGLTHLGAREYDPTTGKFISVDPIMDLTDPQQWNPYTYSGNNPTTWSDPTGLKRGLLEAGGGGGGGGVIALLFVPGVLETLAAFGVPSLILLAYVAGTEVGPFDFRPERTVHGGILLSAAAGQAAIDNLAKPGTATVVDEDGNPLAAGDPIAEGIKTYVDQALEDWANGNIGFNKDQEAKIKAHSNPNQLAAALKGTILDEHVKELIENDNPELATKLFGTASGLYGPDWINVTNRKNRPAEEADWYDLTTGRTWGAHVKKYSGTGNGKLGTGVGIIWNSVVRTFTRNQPTDTI